MRPVLEQLERYTVLLAKACSPILGSLTFTDIEDIVLNPDGAVWQRRRSTGWTHIGEIRPDRAYDVVSSIAASEGRDLNQSLGMSTIFPSVEPRLNGSRFEACVPPLVRSPIFALRIKGEGQLALSDYESVGSLTDAADPLNVATTRVGFLTQVKGLPHGEILRRAVMARQNILVAGPTGSGKTTFADALLAEIGHLMPDDRVVYIEDTPELVCNIRNSVDLASCGGIDMLGCVRIAMRLRPRRIVVGEVRGAEAHALLKAWNTGHPGGIATVHADDAYSALLRIESLVAESTLAPQQDLIAQAIRLVVFLEEEPRCPAGRKVRQILAVTGYDHALNRYETVSL